MPVRHVIRHQLVVPAAVGGGTVTYDTFSFGSTTWTSGNDTVVTVAHTVAAQANAALFVCIGWGDKGANDGTGSPSRTVTYNGASMTLVPNSLVHSNNNTAGYIAWYYIVLGTGDGTSHNIVYTDSRTQHDAGGDIALLVAVSAYGVDQTTPIVGSTAATGYHDETAPITLNGTSSSGNLMLWGFGAGSSISVPLLTDVKTYNVSTASACGNIEVQRNAGAASATGGVTSGDWSAGSYIDVKAA